MKHIAVYICAAMFAMCCLLTSCQEAVPAVSDGFGRDSGGTYSEGNTADGTHTSDDGITICVDPGHGFEDVGTTSDYLGDWGEKDVTFSIATMLKEELEALGYRVMMLHDGVTIPKSSIDDGNNRFKPAERIDSIKNADIDYYVSIHCDSYAADESVMGTRVYYANGTKFENQSRSAASDIKNAINDLLPDAKKARVIAKEYDDAYYVIREAPVPSSLIEVGFVTNPTDAANMLREDWRRAMAKGIAVGIDKFFAE